MMSADLGGLLVALASFVLTFLAARGIRRWMNSRDQKANQTKAESALAQQSRQVRRAHQRKIAEEARRRDR